MSKNFAGTRDNNLPIISYVTRKLISGYKNEFSRQIGQELNVRFVTKDSAVPLIGIRGDVPNMKVAEGLIRELDQKAQIIADRNGLKTTGDLRPEHWDHLRVDVTSLLQEARKQLSKEISKSLATSGNAADKAPEKPLNDNTKQGSHSSNPSSQAELAAKKAFTDATSQETVTATKPKKHGTIKVISPTFEPRNESQALSYIAALDSVASESGRRTFVNSYVYMGGPAGGGKTFTALRAGVDAYNAGMVDQILIIRPPTTAGKDPGAMPGNQHKKSAPYVAGGIASNLEKITGLTLEKLESMKAVRGITPDWERGETYGTPESPVFVVIDEPQNLTIQQTELLATRLGQGSIMLWSGDIGGKQFDLKREVPGLAHLIATQGAARMTNPQLDRATAFVLFNEEDSAARNSILPHVLKALNSPPDDYAKLLKTFNDVGANAALTGAIESIRLYAVDVFDKAATATNQRYVNKMKAEFPALFQKDRDSNVTPLKLAVR